MYAYYNSGLSFKFVSDDYEKKDGEVLFQNIATNKELKNAFENYQTEVEKENLKSLIVEAQRALDKTDVTVLRCLEAGVEIPENTKNYRAALRLIMKGESDATELPELPELPSGI